jgi:hypothetical protein
LDRRRPIPQMHCPVAAAATKGTWATASCPFRVWTLPRSPPRDIARRPPGSFATRCATDPTTATRRWNCRRGLGRSWLLATAAADEVGELRLRSCCAENRKSVLIRYARSRSDSVRRSGCRRSASCRTFVGARETRRSWLSKIICGVIFYETLCKADAPAPERAVDSPPEAAIRSNFRLPIASTALGSSSGTPWTILSQGNRYADDDHQFES